MNKKYKLIHAMAAVILPATIGLAIAKINGFNVHWIVVFSPVWVGLGFLGTKLSCKSILTKLNSHGLSKKKDEALDQTVNIPEVTKLNSEKLQEVYTEKEITQELRERYEGMGYEAARIEEDNLKGTK